jgi:hypothetical protein
MTTLFDLDQYTVAKVVHDPYWDEIALDCSGKDNRENWPVLPFSKQESDVLEDAIINISELPEQEKQDHPEHRKTQWVEKYSVKRGGTKHWYYRYCYFQNNRITHVHIPGGNSSNAIAISRRKMIERAIALGKTPLQIENFIRGGFGANGNKMILELSA